MLPETRYLRSGPASLFRMRKPNVQLVLEANSSPAAAIVRLWCKREQISNNKLRTLANTRVHMVSSLHRSSPHNLISCLPIHGANPRRSARKLVTARAIGPGPKDILSRGQHALAPRASGRGRRLDAAGARRVLLGQRLWPRLLDRISCAKLQRLGPCIGRGS